MSISGIRIKPEDDIYLSKSMNINLNNQISNNNSNKNYRSNPNTPNNLQNTIDITIGETKHEFHYDHIFLPTTNQQKIFQDCAISIITNALDGTNGTILMYGQTGAGKTYTMTGPSIDSEYDQQGLVMRTGNYILEQSKVLINSNESILIRLSVLEIYNETLIDLLNDNSIPNPSNTHKNNIITSKLSIIETNNGIIIPALYILPISSEFDTYSLLLQAMNNRNVSEHQLNKTSSRSHVIYTFYITRTKQKLVIDNNYTDTNNDIDNNIDEYDIIQSKLHLVDLAGSERVEKTGSVGIVQKEASYINRSLSYLEQVVLALLQSKRDHIPYRQSKLTLLLKDSLSGSCNTYLLACVWPHSNYEYETLSTLRFATRMKGIKNHPTKNSLQNTVVNNINGNKENKEMKILLNQIDNLKKVIIEKDLLLDQLNNNSTVNLSNNSTINTSNNKINYIKAFKIAKLIANENPNDQNISTNLIDNTNLAQIKQILNFLRNFLWDSCNYDTKRIQKSILSVNNKLNNSLIQLLDSDIDNQSSIKRNNILLAKEIDKQIDKQMLDDQLDKQLDSNFNSPTNKLDNQLDNRLESPVDNQIEKDLSDLFSSNQSISKPYMSFEEYILGPGKQLNDVYTDIKENIKQNKHKQKELIQSINLTKSQIDNLTNEIKYINGKINIHISTTKMVVSKVVNQINSDIDDKLDNVVFRLEDTRIDRVEDSTVDNDILQILNETIDKIVISNKSNDNDSSNDVLSIDKISNNESDSKLSTSTTNESIIPLDTLIDSSKEQIDNNDNTSIYPTFSTKPTKPKLKDNFLSITSKSTLDNVTDNKIDSTIDQTHQQLQSKLNDLNNQLLVNKKTYSLLKDELDSCKIQLTNDNNKKKQVINQLLENYQNYTNS